MLSPAYRRACEAKYPTDFMSREQDMLSMAFSAEDRSLMSSVLYIRLGRNKVFMERIEDVIRKEVRYRIDLDTFDVNHEHRKTASGGEEDETDSDVEDRSKKRSSKRPRLHAKSKTPRHGAPDENQESGPSEKTNTSYNLLQAVRFLESM